MLDRNDQGKSAADLIAALPCRVVIPPKLEERFKTEGIAPSTPDERRMHPRLRCRDKDHMAGLRYIPTYPALQRSDSWSAVFLADMSRGGMQILSHEPLYPGERLSIFMKTGTQLTVQVVRCRRLGEACFSIGTSYVRNNPDE
jgi:hypothetical protein